VTNWQQGLEVKRRYSEFASLRAELVRLHPTLIVPPIPEKHTMADYAAKPTKAKEDAGIIELRKRMLAVFLNRCRKMKDILEDGVFWRFLDPYTSWVCFLSHGAVSPIQLTYFGRPTCSTAHPSPTFQSRSLKRPRSIPRTLLKHTAIFHFLLPRRNSSLAAQRPAQVHQCRQRIMLQCLRQPHIPHQVQ